MPTLAILIVTYNSDTYLKQLLNSIDTQSSSGLYGTKILIYDGLVDPTDDHGPYDYLKYCDLGKMTHVYTKVDSDGKTLSYIDAVNLLVQKAAQVADNFIIINPDTTLDDTAVLSGVKEKLPWLVLANFDVYNLHPRLHHSIGGNRVNLFGQFIVDKREKAFKPITITGAAFAITRYICTKLTEPRDGNLFLPWFDMYGEDTELGLYYVLSIGLPISRLELPITHIGGGSQEVGLGEYCPQRRYLACRNQVLLWAAHAQNFLWFYVFMSLLYIPLEALYVLFRYPTKGWYYLFDIYIASFLDAISSIPLVRMQAGKYPRSMSDYEFIRTFAVCSFKREINK